MTKQGERSHWFNSWIQEDEGLESNRHHLFLTDIDFLVSRLKNGEQLWMLLELKAANGKMSNGQFKDFNRLHRSIDHPNYRGFHILKANLGLRGTPSLISKDTRKLTLEELRQFILFEGPAEWYQEGPKD